MTGLATQAALDAAFKADATVQAVLGKPVRLYNGQGGKVASFPHALWRGWETRPADSAEVAADEHVVTLDVLSRAGAPYEAQDAATALARVCQRPPPLADTVRIIVMTPLSRDIIRPADGRGWVARLRIRVIAEAL